VLLKHERRSEGLAPINTKRDDRLKKKHRLLLERLLVGDTLDQTCRRYLGFIRNWLGTSELTRRAISFPIRK
jgi:hypothetical protein